VSRKKLTAEEFYRAQAELEVDAFLRRKRKTKLDDSDLPGVFGHCVLACASTRVRERLGRLRAPDFMPKAPPPPDSMRRWVKSLSAERTQRELDRRRLLRKIGNAIARPRREWPGMSRVELERLEQLDSLATTLAKSGFVSKKAAELKARAKKLRDSYDVGKAVRTLRTFLEEPARKDRVTAKRRAAHHELSAELTGALDAKRRAVELDRVAEQILAYSKEEFTPKRKGSKPARLEVWRHVVARMNGFRSGPAFWKQLKHERKKPA
jgi:hypothetical protein